MTVERWTGWTGAPTTWARERAPQATKALAVRDPADPRGRAAGRGARGLPPGADLPGQRSVPAVRAQLHRGAVERRRLAAERVLRPDHPGHAAARPVDHPAGAASGGAGHGRAGVRGAEPLWRPDVAGRGGLRPGAVRPAATRPRAVRPGRRLDRLPGRGRPRHPGLATGKATEGRQNPEARAASGGRLRAAPRAGRDVPGRNADHDRPGRPVRAGRGPTAAPPAHPAGRAHRVLPDPGDRLSRLVRRLARRVELHHLQRRVPVRPGGGLRLLPGAEPARVREAAVPHAADGAA